MLLLKKDYLNNFYRWCNKKGFTLIEVLVAMAILSIGSIAISYYYSAYFAMKNREQESIKGVIAATEYIESAIVNPLTCIDSEYVVKVEKCVILSVKKNVVSPISRLAELKVTPIVGCISERRMPIVFRRIVFCK